MTAINNNGVSDSAQKLLDQQSAQMEESYAMQLATSQMQHQAKMEETMIKAMHNVSKSVTGLDLSY